MSPRSRRAHSRRSTVAPIRKPGRRCSSSSGISTRTAGATCRRGSSRRSYARFQITFGLIRPRSSPSRSAIGTGRWRRMQAACAAVAGDAQDGDRCWPQQVRAVGQDYLERLIRAHWPGLRRTSVPGWRRGEAGPELAIAAPSGAACAARAGFERRAPPPKRARALAGIVSAQGSHRRDARAIPGACPYSLPDDRQTVREPARG